MREPDQIAIQVERLSKTFKLPHEKQSSIKSSLINFKKHGYELQRALDDVSFEVKQGEFFGIVGRNGSGKSTLLKLLAGIYMSTAGRIQINGSLVPFIELGVGFNPELTGRENVFLNGSLLGFNRKEMNKMYDDVVAFAELERFMDQKLKNYSSGMQVRLAFSIAIRAHGDILLLDEVLAVGDSAFQQKCYEYFNNLKKEKRTIILVSHNMPVIDQYCDRALLLEQGRIKHIGSSSEIAGMYEDMFIREEAERIRKELKNNSSDNKDGIIIDKIEVLQAGKKNRAIEARKDFEIWVTVKANTSLDNANVGINIKNREKIMLAFTDTYENIGSIKLEKGVKTTVKFKLQNIFSNGLYLINVGIADVSQTQHKVIARKENAQQFTVSGIGVHSASLTHPDVSVEIAEGHK